MSDPTNVKLRNLHEILMRASEELNKAPAPPPPKKENVVPLSSQVNTSVLEDIKNGADRSRHLIATTFGEVTAHTTNNLDNLIDQIMAVRDLAIDRQGQAEAVMNEHLAWATEAALFAETVRARLKMFAPQVMPEVKVEPEPEFTQESAKNG